MTKSLLSCIAIFLTSISSSANVQDTSANSDTANITTITSGEGTRYVIDKTSGFCYLPTTDLEGTHGTLVPVATPIQELESFASSDFVKERMAIVAEQKNNLSGYAKTIAIESESLRQEIGNITRILESYPPVFAVLINRTHEAILMLDSFSNESNVWNTQDFKRASSLSLNSTVTDGFDIQNTIIISDESIMNNSWQLDLIAEEIEYARKASGKIITAATTEIGRVDSILQQNCKKWDARIYEIKQQITPDMDEGAQIAAKTTLLQIHDEIDREAEDLYEYMSAMYYNNPWGNLERLIEECTQSLEKNNLEVDAMKATELADNIRQLDLPGLIIENAARENWTIRVPTEFGYNDESFTITRINGNILTSTATRATSGNLTVIIPESITLLENGALASKSVTTVVSENPVPPSLDIANPPFSGMWEISKILIVPDEAVNSYQQSAWSDYFSIILPMSVASVDNPENDSDNQRQVFTLQGIRVGNNIEELPKGIYIIRDGYRTSKVSVD